MAETVEISLKDILQNLDSKIDKLSENMESKMEKLGQEVNHKIEKLDNKIDEVRKEVNQKVDKLSEDVNELKGDVKALEKEVTGLGTRLENQEFLNRTITVALASAFFLSVTKLLFPNFLGKI